jgi:thiol:disulfide interchange protein
VLRRGVTTARIWPALAALAACGPAPVPTPTIVLAPLAPAPSVEAPTAPTAERVRAPAAVAPIAWETSEPAARERAQRARLPLLVWVAAAWSAGSVEMERKTWTDPSVIEAARPFVALRLDVSSAEGDAERYAERYDVKAVPTTILFDARGRRVLELPGSRDAATVAAALKRAAEE